MNSLNPLWFQARSSRGVALTVLIAFAATSPLVRVIGQVNTPPTISAVTNETTPENTLRTIGFVVGDAESPPDQLTVTAAADNAALVPNTNLAFGGSGANRTLTITPQLNTYGTCHVTVTVTDPGGLSTSTSFQLTVTFVNQPPRISAIANQTIFANSATAPLAFIIGDIETPPDSLVLTAASDQQTLVPNGNLVFGGAGANRTVTVTPAANQTGTATISVTAADAASLTAMTSFSLAVNPLPSPLVAGALRRDLFSNVPGGRVTDLTGSPNFPAAPDATGLINSFEAPSNIGDNYGQRLSGYILPPVTGSYLFYISSDDQSALHLSTDASPANKVQIATEPQWNGPRQWVNGWNQSSRGNPPANVSAPIALVAGQAYYVEVLHKEGGGGDNVGVTWQLPGASAPASGDPPIAGQYLAYDGSMTITPFGSFASDFNNFRPLSAPPWTFVNGDAKNYDDSSGGVGNSGVLKLTTATGVQAGTFIIDDLNGGQPIGGFTATFKLRIGGGTTPPADGFSFNFAPDIDTGALYTEEGGGSGLTVSFDTYDDGDEAPALDIKFAGQLIARKWFSGSWTAGRDIFRDQAGNEVSLETGDAFEDVRIDLKPNGTVSLQYKGLTIYDNLFIPTYAPMHGRFALGARTGGATDNHFVDNLTIVTVPVSSAPASILQPPPSQTVGEQSPVTFTVIPGGGAPFSFQWFRSDVAINGATGQSYSISSASTADNGASFKVEVTNAGGNTTSDAAVLTVTADTVAPTVVKASSDIAFDNVLVRFSKPVSDTALLASDYAIDQGVTVSSVSRVDLLTVKLATSKLAEGKLYNLTINGVQDTTISANTIAANTQAQFRSLVFLAGAVLHQKYNNVSDGTGGVVANLFIDPRFPHAADHRDLEPMWEYPAAGLYRDQATEPDGAQYRNYFDTIEGFFIPPTSGNYVFFTCGSDRWWLYLSTDESPANKHRIAAGPGGWTNPRGWITGQGGTDMTLCRSDQSTYNVWPSAPTISLQAGKRYYMLSVHHDPSWGGADDFAATYKLESDPDPVDGDAPKLTGSVVGYYFDPNGASVTFTEQPQNATAMQGSTATFTAAATGTSAYGNTVLFQWESAPKGSTAWTPIPGATAPTFETRVLAGSDDGRQYRLVASNASGNAVSTSATLSVLQTELLFSDTFNVSSAGVSVNTEYNAGRQAGTVSPLTYSAWPSADVQLNTSDAPGQLRLSPGLDNAYVSVSPDHNFTESGRFSVEFDVNVGIDDDVNPSGDYWAGVVIGSRFPNAWVQSPDGFGFLFRNGVAFSFFDGPNWAGDGFPGEGFLNGLLPIGLFHVRLDVTTANFAGSPATIRMVIDGVEVRLGNGVGKEYVKGGGFFANRVTLGGTASYGTIPRVHVFDNLAITAFPCIEATQRQPFLIVGPNPDHIRVALRPWMNRSQAVSVTLTSQDPTVAVPTGGSGGALTLNFPAGAPTEQTVSVTGLAAGMTQFVLSTPNAFCTGNPLPVTVGGVVGSPVVLNNPSFELDTFTVMPGYDSGNGPITGWTAGWPGGSGINPVSGQNPFADNGQIPDGQQVAFMQGVPSLSQTINGFTVGAPYCLRYRENARNCCGGAFPGMDATMDGLVIVDQHTVTPVGSGNPYHTVTSAKFFAARGAQTLSLAKSSPPGSDATALIDLVEIIPVTGPFVRSFVPVGGGVPTDAPIVIVLEDGFSQVNSSSIQLTLDGAGVSPIITQSGDLTTVQFQLPGSLVPNSHHTVSLAFGDNAPSPTVTVSTFSFDAGVLSSAPGAFFIEAEDFNYGGGQHQGVADTMPYYGGAYNSLAAVQGIDYFGVSPDDPGANIYGVRGDPNVGIRASADSSRGSFNLTADYIVGWNNAGDWFNYTRDVPAGTYNIYARLSSGWADEHARLDLVTSGATTPDQSLVKLGNLDASATGSGDTFGFVPLKTDSGQLAVMHLSGLHTLRFTVLPGTLDFNYLALVPASAPSGPAPTLVSVFAFNGNQVTVTFDQPLDPVSASDPLHYSVDGATITSATVVDGGNKVLLTVTGFTGSSLNVTVNGVFSINGMPIAANTTGSGTVLPLQAVDVGTGGDPIEPGATYPVGDGAFDVIAGGSDIWGSADHFQFAYEAWSGDFDMAVQVTHLDGFQTYTKAAIMIRQDLSPGSPNAKIDVTPPTGAGNYEAQSRAVQDGSTMNWPGTVLGPAPIPNAWLRLKRQGALLTAYRSFDGTDWDVIGQLHQTFTDPVLVGLATTAHDNLQGHAAHASYRNLQIGPALPDLAIAASASAIMESSTTPATFRISVPAIQTAPLTVAYTIGGSANPGTDYQTIPNSVTIPAGAKVATISLAPINNLLPDGPRTVTLTLAPVAGYSFASRTATITILDDESPVGLVKREIYRNIGGTTVADLRNALTFPDYPDSTDFIPTLESGTLGLDYGQRLSGYLMPPTGGSYVFYLSSDDQSELWLSTDQSPANKVRIATNPQSNDSRDWTSTARRNPSNPENMSLPIPLTAGQKYYFEVLHKQATGGDHVEVTWQKPSDPVPANGSPPIGSTSLGFDPVLTIAPPSVIVSAPKAGVFEASPDSALFSISRVGPASDPLTVNFTLGGTAQAGVDYEQPATSVTLPPGQVSALVPIKPIDDALVEGNETVTLTPTASATYRILGTGSASVTIFDDDAPLSGFLLREVYDGVPGTTVAALTSAPTFPNMPDQMDLVPLCESSIPGNNYGERLSGFLLPPTSGSYTFYMSADDQAQLWLSPDENPAHKILLATEPSWNGPRQWLNGSNQGSRGNPPANVSMPVVLNQAQRYYIEVLHKQAGGGVNVAVAWQRPGDSGPPANGSDPILGIYLAVRYPLLISSLSPSDVHSGGGDFTLTVNGSGFADGAVVNWNGSPRLTSFVNQRQLTATIVAADIAPGTDIRTAYVTVQNPGGEISQPIVFTIGSATVAVADSSLAPPGGTVVVSSAPMNQSDAGQAGVSASFNNTDPASSVSVTAATYSSNPNAGTLFDVGAGYVDLQVAGAHPADSMSANFYYPSTVTGATEDSLVLLYFNGSVWAPVLSSGGVSPVKDPTDNLDGTVTGGRFSVVFDSASTPKITELAGTAFAPTVAAVAFDRTPPVPDGATLPDIHGQCSATIPSAPTATDAVTGKVQGTTTDPLIYTVQGTFTVTWRYNDGNGNESTQTQTVIVQDTTLPTITCPLDTTAEFSTASGAAVNYPPPVVTDNCSGATSRCTPAAGSQFPIGTTPITCVAKDAVGNTASCSFQVTVLGAWGVSQNVLHDLAALRATVTNKGVGHELDEAIQHLTGAVDPKLWIDQAHVVADEGENVFGEAAEAVNALGELIHEKPNPISAAVLQDFINRLVKNARLLAVVAMNDATTAHADAEKLAQASKALSAGDANVAKGQYGTGIEDYREAWQKAIASLQKGGDDSGHDDHREGGDSQGKGDQR